MNDLILPMMMFGSYKASWQVKDQNGQKIKKTKTIVHQEELGDPGFFPSVNHIYYSTPRGGRRLTKAAEHLKDRWKRLLLDWCTKESWTMTEKEKVVIEVLFCFPDHIIRDNSNIYKLLMDAMEGVIFDNDYYALPRTMDFVVSKLEKPHLRLRIYKKSDEASR